MLEQQLLSEKIADEEKRGMRMPEIFTQSLRLDINRAAKRGIISRVSDQSSDSREIILRDIHTMWCGGRQKRLPGRRKVASHDTSKLLRP